MCQGYCKQGPDNLSDCPGAGRLKLVVFYITIARGIIGNVVSKNVRVPILPSILDTVTDFIVFSPAILH